ncbi:MAG TPA: hypothetical protein VJK30_05790 [Coxiellaceae bacterium]|nr:hypothetical protein [Coxiellaceae bacterium]
MIYWHNVTEARMQNVNIHISVLHLVQCHRSPRAIRAANGTRAFCSEL